MTEDRLNGLALSNIYRGVEVSCENIWDIKAKHREADRFAFIIIVVIKI